MALGRLTSFTFGTSFLTLVYDNSQTFYVSYAHLIGFESDPRSGDLTIYIYTAGEVSETLSVRNSDLVAIGSSAAAFVALMNQNIQPYSYWEEFLASTTANGALPTEPSALRGQCLYARFQPLYNSGSPSLINVPARFKAGTLYSQVPDTGAGDFTVTRTTTPTANRSTRINKDGLIELVNDNVPRLDYPLGGAVNGCPALLVEPSATNLLQRSEEFNDAYWGKTGLGTGSVPVVTPNVELAPDGTNNADRIVFALNGGTTSSDESRLNSATLTYAAASHISSVYIRTTDGSTVTMTFLNADGQSANKTITPTYQRITHITTGAGTSSFRIRLRGGVTSDSASVAIWGAQYEAGSVATSYIPTTTAAVTRSNEVISDTTASALIGQTEGTIYAEVDVRAFASSAARRIVNLRVDGSNLLSLEINTAGTGFDFAATSGGSSVTAFASGITTGIYKIAVGYNSAASGTALYVNGTLRDTKTISIPNLSAAVFGLGVRGDGGAGTQLNDRIRAVALYPNRIPNTAAPGVLSLATLTAP